MTIRALSQRTGVPTERIERQLLYGGLNTFTAEFYSDRRIVCAELKSAEVRLVDHLNGSDPWIEVRPLQVTQVQSGSQFNLNGTVGNVTKAHVLLAIVLREPPRAEGAHAAAWKTRVKRRLWAGVGPYRVVGTLAAEIGPDRTTARIPDRQFLSLTDATVTMPDGSVRDCGYVILNRLQADLLAMQDQDGSHEGRLTSARTAGRGASREPSSEAVVEEPRATSFAAVS
jgi:hypothetical protein